MKSRWEGGVDAYEGRQFGWWSGSGGGGIVSFSEEQCLSVTEVEC